MITESLFKNCIGSLKNESAFESKLYKMGIDTFDAVELQELKMSFVNLLSYLCEDENESEYIPSIIECFIFDGYCVVNVYGKDIRINTIDDLWKYLVKTHPEIEDKEKSE